MSYRNDHDAAVTRIDALERELEEARDAAREKAARDEGRIAMLERELADLRRHESDRPRRKPTKSPPPKPAPSIDELDRKTEPRGPAVSLGLLGIILVFIAIVAGAAIYMAFGDRRGGAMPDNTCTVNSLDNAHVFADGDDLGPTPVRMTFREWRKYSRVQLRGDGYEPLTIPSPATDCDEHFWKLYRK